MIDPSLWFPDELTEDATYQKGAGQTTIRVHFFTPFSTTLVGETPVANPNPRVLVEDSDVAGIDKTATFTIRGTLYHILEIRPDGTGVTEVQLSQDPRA